MRSGKNRFDDQSVVEVATSRLNVIFRRRDQPPSVLGAAKKRAKARRAIETGQAQPIDRTVASDQRYRLAVPNDGVVLDSKRHRVVLSGKGWREKAPSSEVRTGCPSEFGQLKLRRPERFSEDPMNIRKNARRTPPGRERLVAKMWIAQTREPHRLLARAAARSSHPGPHGGNDSQSVRLPKMPD
jgi:hypothetical protein